MTTQNGQSASDWAESIAHDQLDAYTQANLQSAQDAAQAAEAARAQTNQNSGQ